jgi:SAM-dependent methyltransferase
MTPHNPRDLEWQRRYEENDTPWDKGIPAPALMRYLQKNSMTGQVLVPGCGRGHEVRALAKQDNCMVMGMDISPSAVAAATQLAWDDGVNAKATFMAGDFFDLPYVMRGAFDWLFEHTCFCAIDPSRRSDYVQSAASALRAGGRMFGIFYLTPDVESGPPFAVSQEELSRLFDPHFTLLDQWVREVTFQGRENREQVRILQKR